MGSQLVGFTARGQLQLRGLIRRENQENRKFLVSCDSSLGVFEQLSASETEDVDPSGPVWLDDHCNLWVSDEVGKVGGDDEGGEGVLGVGPVPPLLLLSNLARKGQARHTADYQTTPVWFLWQFPHGLLSSIFAPKGRGRWRKPRSQCQCELKDKS